jgi:hypothetical protein
MEKAEAPEPARAASGTGQFGDENGVGIADDDQLRPALAIDKKSDLFAQNA